MNDPKTLDDWLAKASPFAAGVGDPLALLLGRDHVPPDEEHLLPPQLRLENRLRCNRFVIARL